MKYFADYQSITVGVLPYHRDFSILNYKHALLIDPFAFYPIRRYPPNSNYIISNGSQGSYRQVIKKHSKTNFFIHLFNYPLIRNNNITHIFNTIPDKKLPSDFISNRYKCFEGSFAASITLAIYMGFRKIYLIGFDYTHFPTRSHHWYEKGRGIINQNKHYKKRFIEIAQEYADIITITLDGKSEYLDYITYKDYTGADPEYKENIEIISGKYLKALSSWPGHNIY